MFRPKTFRNGGCEVTINGDRPVNVKQGDWLSRYSMAIYGDFDHIDTGHLLYHLDTLPGELSSPRGKALADPNRRRERHMAALRGSPKGSTAHRRSAMRPLEALGQLENREPARL